jgi:amino acid transporter
MGRDRILPPRVFGYIHPRYQTPALNIALAGVVGLIALALDVATSTSFINFGAFLAFTAVNLCVVRLYLAGRQGGEKIAVVPGLIFPLIGAIADIWLLVSLDRAAQILGVIWFAVGLAYLCWLTRFFRKPPPSVPV